jgi:hypothetical protein
MRYMYCHYALFVLYSRRLGSGALIMGSQSKRDERQVI